jgi:hypothetical protein
VSRSLANHDASLPEAYQLHLPKDKDWAKARSSAQGGWTQGGQMPSSISCGTRFFSTGFLRLLLQGEFARLCRIARMLAPISAGSAAPARPAGASHPARQPHNRGAE